MDAPIESSNLRVRRRDDIGRYELYDGHELLSFAPFTEKGDVITIPHVETRLQYRGNGYASLLLGGFVDDLRHRGLRVDATCPVARRFIQSLPDADELMVR